MNHELLVRELKESICKDIDVFPEGKSRFAVDTPFCFEDGDSFTIILKKIENQWYFTDEGHTLMHLSYEGADISLEKGNRKQYLYSILTTHYIENDNGELKCSVEDEHFGDALFTFIQGLAKITDLSFISRERITSLFREDLREYLKETFKEKCFFDYKDPVRDPDGKYTVDCYVKYEKPLFIFGLSSDSRCKDAIITCLTFKDWNASFNSIGIFEDSGKINNKVMARSIDAIEKQFSTLQSTKDGLPEYLENMSIGMN